MIGLGWFVLICVAWFVITVALHEAGHYLVAVSKGYKTRFGADARAVFVEVLDQKQEDESSIRLGGLLFGLLPSVVCGVVFSFWFGLVLLVAYLVGTWSEWKMVGADEEGV